MSAQAGNAEDPTTMAHTSVTFPNIHCSLGGGEPCYPELPNDLDHWLQDGLMESAARA